MKNLLLLILIITSHRLIVIHMNCNANSAFLLSCEAMIMISFEYSLTSHHMIGNWLNQNYPQSHITNMIHELVN
jgi:hypothetical protein